MPTANVDTTWQAIYQYTYTRKPVRFAGHQLMAQKNAKNTRFLVTMTIKNIYYPD